MTPSLRAALEQRLGTAVQSTRPLSGGDINDTFEVALRNGDRIFVKTHPNPPGGMFEAEAHGLRWLKEAEAVRVPEVLAFSDDHPAYLALELLTGPISALRRERNPPILYLRIELRPASVRACRVVSGG